MFPPVKHAITLKNLASLLKEARLQGNGL